MRMEDRGVKVDTELLDELGKEYTKDAEMLETVILRLRAKNLM